MRGLYRVELLRVEMAAAVAVVGGLGPSPTSAATAEVHRLVSAHGCFTVALCKAVRAGAGA